MDTKNKTIIIESATENCDLTAMFSEKDIFEEARAQIDQVNNPPLRL